MMRLHHLLVAGAFAALLVFVGPSAALAASGVPARHTAGAIKVAPAADGTYTAKLNAAGPCGRRCHAYFRFRVVRTKAWKKTRRVRFRNRARTVRFSRTIARLRPATRYEYQLCVKLVHGRFRCRGPDGTGKTTKKFTTPRRRDGGSGGNTGGGGGSGGGPTPVDLSGQAMPTGDVPGWHQVFADDFSADVPLGSFPGAVASKWSAYRYPAHDSSGNGTYWPEKVVSIKDGVMDLYLHTESGIHAVAAPQPKVTPTDPYGQRYGRYSIRFRATNNMPCYKTAWLLWPDDGVWPAHGEIDFPEASLDGADTISAFVHHGGSARSGAQDTFDTVAKYDVWHTATTEWTPGAVNVYLDGSLIGTSVHSPSTAMHWVIQTETGLSGCVPASSTAGHVQIDWAVAYARA
jgi:Glycosyl hydrolases family 16